MMALKKDDPKLTAYVLGELNEAESSEIEKEINSNEEIRREIQEIKSTVNFLNGEFADEPKLELPKEKRSKITESQPQKKFAWLSFKPIATAVASIAGVGILFTFMKPQQGTIDQVIPPVETEVRSEIAVRSQEKKEDVKNTPAKPRVDRVAPSKELTKQKNAAEGIGSVAKSSKAKGNQSYYAAPAVGGRSAQLMDTTGAPARSRVKRKAVAKKIRPHGTVGIAPSDLGYGFVPPVGGRFNTESYDSITDNAFKKVNDEPLSTFSIDVDTASYSNLRRFVNMGQLPPKGAIRIEEMVNYFDYEYAGPVDKHPFAVHLEAASAPWKPDHRLVRIGLKGKTIAQKNRPSSNLVFLLDVSGSMNSYNKLGLLKQAMKLLVNQLGPKDRVAIVVYAGASGLVLPSTSAAKKSEIISALDRLRAGGSTNGGAGIQLAYDVAQAHFIKGGTNRVILATDGDFNVGTTSRSSLVDLAKQRAKSGTFLSVLGFGMGNYKDAMLEQIANKANGNYFYIDNQKEAKKVLVEQMTGTLVTIAKDVKIQVEFNPAHVQAYRLIGYENRMLAAQDFNDDKKDAGEIGAGHTVTALYEIVPTGVEFNSPGVDPLKYQKPSAPVANSSKEMMTVKLRYKKPDGDKSQLVQFPLVDGKQKFAQASGDFKFAASVAGVGMILRESPHKGNANLGATKEWALSGKGADQHGYRAEFIGLIDRIIRIKGGQPQTPGAPYSTPQIPPELQYNVKPGR